MSEETEKTTESAEKTEEVTGSGVPKNFMIRCPKCAWGRATSGVAADLTDLHEEKKGCKSCGKWRRFKCAKCGASSPMKRIKGNS